MKNICSRYDEHMETETVTETENITDTDTKTENRADAILNNRANAEKTTKKPQKTS